MNDFEFQALGTKWCISVDDGVLKESEKKNVLNYVSDFENRFSRFLADSEVNAFRNVGAGEYEISEELSVLLTEADRLRILTNGVYDPAAGELLERAGYGVSYNTQPSDDINEFVLPKWSLNGRTLVLDGPTAFDLGGIGKGYCIDKVAGLLMGSGYKCFVVDGGGDMYATTKKDGSPWRTAIQYPGKPDMAAGIVELKNQALAVSDSFRRRWRGWHHIVNPKLKTAVENIIGAVAIAQNAWHADCMTSALFLSTSDAYTAAAREYGTAYLAFQKDGTCIVSSNWNGELF